jgi:chromate transporter
MSKTVVLPQTDSPSVVASVSFWQAFRFWLKLGFISFGGPAGQIAMMHQELVDNRRWISEGRFLHALNFCMVLPGPEAQQLATYIGWLMHKTWEASSPGCCLFCPRWCCSSRWRGSTSSGEMSRWWRGFLWHQTRRGGDRAAGGAPHRLAGAEKWRLLGHRRRSLCRYFCAERSFSADRPAAAIVGLSADGWRRRPSAKPTPIVRRVSLAEPPSLMTRRRSRPTPCSAGGARVLIAGILLWLVPMATLALMLGWAHPLTQMSWFFTKAALMTFGGAYAVLPYVYQGR